MTILAFAIFLLALGAFAISSVALFYHIGRYSYIGDFSKRLFFYYTSVGAIITFVTLVGLIVNHIIS